MNGINWSGMVFAVALGVAGYCFGGRIGLGIAMVLVALIQMLPR